MELSRPSVEKVHLSAYTIPTDAPESDGTLEWDSTTLIICEIHAGETIGLGYTYGNQATAAVIDHLAEKCLLRQSALDVSGLHAAMLRQVRNDGSRGIASMAISALDVALWDLKAKVLQCSVVDLLGVVTPGVSVYGSGGFTTYTNAKLAQQLSGWARDGIKAVKMKIGSEPTADMERVLRSTRCYRTRRGALRRCQWSLQHKTGSFVC